MGLLMFGWVVWLFTCDFVWLFMLDCWLGYVWCCLIVLWLRKWVLYLLWFVVYCWLWLIGGWLPVCVLFVLIIVLVCLLVMFRVTCWGAFCFWLFVILCMLDWGVECCFGFLRWLVLVGLCFVWILFVYCICVTAFFWILWFCLFGLVVWVVFSDVVILVWCSWWVFGLL